MAVRTRNINAVTKRNYDDDWQAWLNWCLPKSIDPVYTTPEELCEYFLYLIDLNRSNSTLNRFRASISWNQTVKYGNLHPAGSNQMVTDLLARYRLVAPESKPKTPLEKEEFIKLLAVCPRTLAGMRNKSMFSMADSGCRGCRTVDLDVENIQWNDNKTSFRIYADGILSLPIFDVYPGYTVSNLKEWLKISKITTGALYRQIPLGGKSIKGRLSPQSFNVIFKTCCNLIGLDNKEFSGHSFRSGKITKEHNSGRRIREVMRISRLTTADQVLHNAKEKSFLTNS